VARCEKQIISEQEHSYSALSRRNGNASREKTPQENVSVHRSTERESWERTLRSGSALVERCRIRHMEHNLLSGLLHEVSMCSRMS